ncbi:MAG: hypothetical protein Q8R30_05640 [bacterium]|nr:hypothetical protein [bacterium]
MSEEQGYSEEKNGVFGKYTEHKNKDGETTGYSEKKDGVFGEYTEHTDTEGKTTGYSENKEGLFGKYTEHTDTNEKTTGYSEGKQGLLGGYVEHTDSSDRTTGWSETKSNAFGRYTEHYGDSHYTGESDSEPHSGDQNTSGHSSYSYGGGGHSSLSNGYGGSRRKRVTQKKTVIALMLVFLSIPVALIVSYFSSKSPVIVGYPAPAMRVVAPQIKEIATIDGWRIWCSQPSGSWCSAKKGDVNGNNIEITAGESELFIALSFDEYSNDYLLTQSSTSIRVNDSISFFCYPMEGCTWLRQDKHGGKVGLQRDIIPYMMQGGILEIRYKNANGQVKEYKIQLGDFSKMYSVLEDAYQKHSHTKRRLVDLRQHGD